MIIFGNPLNLIIDIIGTDISMRSDIISLDRGRASKLAWLAGDMHTCDITWKLPPNDDIVW